tara:strand:- start:131 stop:958 length:828 start_codon:yes stop_codon:yes gene_type:complete
VQKVMLSQKIQNDLMAAYQKVYEEKTGHAAGDSDAEKQASQLASDVRYKAKSKVPEGASEEEKKKIFLQILNASPAPNVVKAMAKQKLLGEEVVSEMRFDDGKEGTEKRKEALRKKRGMTKDQMDKHPQFKTEEKAPRMQKGAMAYDGPNKERSEAADRVIAKTKEKRKKMREEFVDEKKLVHGKFGNFISGQKITKTKEKPLTPEDRYKIPEGMDPVGKEDKDIDNDGDHDSTDKYLMNRRKAIGKAIAKKRGRVKEGFSAWRIDLDFNEQVKK